MKALDLNNTNQKKSFIRSRTSYPKLLKKASGMNGGTMSILQGEKL